MECPDRICRLWFHGICDEEYSENFFFVREDDRSFSLLGLTSDSSGVIGEMEIIHEFHISCEVFNSGDRSFESLPFDTLEVFDALYRDT